MSRLVTLRIAHRLGQAEARRRLQVGIGRARAGFGTTFSSVEETWNGNHLDFRVGTFGQVVTGTLDVGEDYIDATFDLPLALAFFANRIKRQVEAQGVLLLGRG